MHTTRNLSVLVITAVLLVVSVACKEGNPIANTISPATAAFEEHDPPAGVSDHLVMLQSGSSTGGRITLDVVLSEIEEPVTGIALKLTYPEDFSKFVECEDGSLFPSGTCYYSEPASGSGEVFIGRAVTGVADATPVDGSEIVVRLEFLVFGVGAGAIRIEGQNLAGSDASAVLDEAGDPILVEWVSGDLVGT
jgi:hypothetical protein